MLASLFLARNVLGGVPGWKFLASWVEFLDEFPRWNFAGGGGSCLGYPGWQFLAFLCLGEKLPRWTYLARKCWNLSSSARLTWVEFCEWKFLSFPLSGCKLLRWSFLGGSSLQCSCSFLEFPFCNLRDLLASLFPQRNFLGGVSWVGYPGWQFLAFLCLGEKLPRWTYLARKCWNLSSSARLTWAKFCEWKFLSFPLSGCKLLRWSFLGGSSFAGFPLSAEKFPRWSFWAGHPGWQFLAFLFLGEKLPRWTYLARKCWNLSSSARLTWVEFCEWKFLSFPLSGCKLLRWSFLGGSSLQCSCSFLEFPFWNLRDLLASLCLQRNFLGGVSWVGYPGWQFLSFLCLGEKLPRWTYLARKCWNLSSSARLTWVEFCEWKFLSFPLSGCKLLRWSFLGGSSLQCSCSFLEFPFWNFRDLLASLFLQRNFLGWVSGWGILAGNSFLFFVLGTKP